MDLVIDNSNEIVPFDILRVYGVRLASIVPTVVSNDDNDRLYVQQSQSLRKWVAVHVTYDSGTYDAVNSNDWSACGVLVKVNCVFTSAKTLYHSDTQHGVDASFMECMYRHIHKIVLASSKQNGVELSENKHLINTHVLNAIYDQTIKQQVPSCPE